MHRRRVITAITSSVTAALSPSIASGTRSPNTDHGTADRAAKPRLPNDLALMPRWVLHWAKHMNELHFERTHTPLINLYDWGGLTRSDVHAALRLAANGAYTRDELPPLKEPYTRMRPPHPTQILTDSPEEYQRTRRKNRRLRRDNQSTRADL